MAEQKYKVGFKGEIVPGADPAAVKRNIAALYNIDIKKVENFFSGKTFVLQDSVSLDQATKFMYQFEEAGAKCDLVKKDPGKPAQTPAVEKAPVRHETCYRVIFKGETVQDKNLSEVKTRLSIFYKVKTEQVEHFFTRKPVTIKDQVDFVTAIEYMKKFHGFGAMCHIEPDELPGKEEDKTVPGSDKYKVVFCGELKAGQDLISVKARLATLLGVQGAVVQKLFLEKPVLVKTDLALDTAQLFKLDFEKTGALCQMLDVSAVPKPPPPPRVLAGIIKPRPVVAPLPPPAVTSPFPRDSGPISPQPITAVPEDSEFSFRQQKKKKSPAPIILTIVGIIAAAAIISLLTSPKKETSSDKSPNISRSSPAKKRSSAASGLLSSQTKPFDDPKGYYSISLPEGYKVANKSSGSRSRISFTYSRKTSVTITALPMKKMWDPQEEMMKKVTGIQRGRATGFSRYQVAGYQIVNFSGMEGYEIILRKSKEVAHAYEMVSSTNVAFSIAIVCMGTNSEQNYNILNSAVRNNLEVY